MIYIGIDNGVTTGGISALSDHPGPPMVYAKLPAVKHRTRNEVCVIQLENWIDDVCCGDWTSTVITIEEPNNSRNPSTAYSVASCFHAIRGMIQTRRKESFRRITPQSWQKQMLGKFQAGESKNVALAKASALWPSENFLAGIRCTTPHTGIIDACLIAEFARINKL